MNNTTHIITGAAGFIGSELTKSLLSKNYKVIGIDNFLLGTRDNIELIKNLNGDFEFIEYDLSLYNNLQLLINNLKNYSDIECIWHLAANSDIRGSSNALLTDLENTFFSTISAGVLSEELNIKEIVFSSSSAVLGTVDKKIEENHGPLLPESYYGAMKSASESYISAIKTYFLEKSTIFRFPNVIGKNTTHGIVFDFKNKLSLKPKFLNVLGDGNQKKPYLYIEDLIDGMLFFKNLESDIRIFNLSPLDSGITVKEIAEIAIKILSPDTIATYENKPNGWPGDVVKYEYSFDKMLSTDWKPKYTSKEAIQESFKL